MKANVYIPVLVVDCPDFMPTTFAYTENPQVSEEKAWKMARAALLEEHRAYYEVEGGDVPEPEIEEFQDPYRGPYIRIDLGEYGWAKAEVNRREVTV